ncbi:MAG TPA: glycoside hydrolase family 99-like domain-containing protein [Bacteroidales bacterium]|nr:glycoside hydrolase family 99-like domain-containing protein [Bacteroidales bacterium]
MKITFQIMITLFLAAITFNSCKEDDLQEKMLTPWKAPETELTEDVLIGAFYDFQFNDTNWLDIDALYLPELGKYHSLNSAVIQQHIEWSVESGIDFWVCPHGQFTDSIIVNVLAGISGFDNISLAMEMSFSSGSTPADLTDSASIQRIIQDMQTMSGLFELPNYLKVDNKPVVVLQSVYNYEPQPLADDITDERVDAMSQLRSALKDSTGYDFYFIGNYVGWFPPDRFEEYPQAFDALTSNMMSNRKALTNFLNENIDLSWEHWKSFLEDRSVAFAPSIFPGRNDTVISTSRADVLPRTAEFFTGQCKLAKYYMDENLRIILINSFNDWHSGTQVEPADNYGATYMDIIKDEFSVN